jgi:MoxR-like ATPase
MAFHMPPDDRLPITFFRDLLKKACESLTDMRDVMSLMLLCHFAGTDRRPSTNHIQLEGLNGLAKTTVVKAYVNAIAGDRLRWFFDITGRAGYTRIQGGPDVSPADVIGFDMLDVDPTTNLHRLRFNPGPFLQAKLCHYFDELNRSPSKTQSCVLEPMAEGGRVTLTTMDRDWRHRRTFRLPAFQMVGSNNPDTQEGTFPLPEAGSDRFMCKIVMRYTDKLADLISGGEPSFGKDPNAATELEKALKKPEFDQKILQLRAEVKDKNAPFRPGLIEYVEYMEESLKWARTQPVPPTVADLGGVEAIMRGITKKASSEEEVEFIDKVEAMLTSARLDELDEQKRAVRETVTLPHTTAEFIASVVYNTWSDGSYRACVGGLAKNEVVPLVLREAAKLESKRSIIRQGASPRAGLALRDLSRSYAYFTRGPGAVVSTSDVEAIARYVLRHRIFLHYQAALGGSTADDAISGIVEFLLEKPQ